MRLILATLVSTITFALWGQEENSLLWEISGNGMQGKSYLYGTMHVSKKIAFHLDDVFYKALEASEIVALESNPDTWLPSDIEERNKNIFGFEAKGFYKDAFHFNELGVRDISRLLATEEGLVNGILYRTNEFSQNFEEDTYLDMFIYRSGRKQGKPVVALEDLEESRTLVALASRNAMKDKPDPWLQERMEREDLMSLVQDAYRSRNISLLDSIDRAMYTEHYLNNMLYLRNQNMTEKLDSIMQSTSVFAGIGAAHLPGDQGVLQMLREQGYSVRPLTSETSEVAEKKKSAITSQFLKPELSTQFPEDRTFSIDLPSALYPVTEATHTTYLSPDLPNGAYFLAHRIPTFQMLPGRERISLEQIENLLFENIPGKIISKERLSNNGFEGLEVRNVLKNGDQQRFQVILTPLEIFIFKLAGKGDYVNQYGTSIFNSLRVANKNATGFIQSPFGEFRVKASGLYRYPNPSRIGNRHLEGIDEAGGYYFFRKVTLNDLEVLEKDKFELKQIQKRFYEGLGLQAQYGRSSKRSLQSRAEIDNSGTIIYLRTVIQANNYYLMGYVGADPSKARAYLASLQNSAPVYPEGFQKIRDTALYFSTVSPVAPRKFVPVKSQYARNKSDLKSYEPFTKKSIYQYRNNEAIVVRIRKSHDLSMVPSLDSLWRLRKKYYLKDDFSLLKSKKEQLPDGSEALLLKIKDTASSRGILVKNVLKGGLLYELRTTIDLNGPQSRFVREFYDNFIPADTLIGRSPIEDKTAEFLAAISRGDSIATEGYSLVRFDKKHAHTLMRFLDTVEFNTNQSIIRTHLLTELAKTESEEVKKFLRAYYERNFSDGLTQARIAQAVTRQAEEDAAKNLLKLLEQDLPLASSAKEIEEIFKPFRKNLEVSRLLFPSLLQYQGIEEFKPEIISLLSAAYQAGHVDLSYFKNYKEILLIDAGMQLKRLMAYESKAGRKISKKHKRTQQLLKAYIPLLFDLRDEPLVLTFFDRLPQLKDAELSAEHLAMNSKAGLEIDLDRLQSLGADLNSRLTLFNSFSNAGIVEQLPVEYRSQRALAEAKVVEGEYFDPNADSLEFVEEKIIEKEGGIYRGYYIKARNSLSYHPNPKMYLLVYEEGSATSSDPLFHSDGWLVSDTRSDEEIMNLLEEQFFLSEHPRAVVYEPGQQNTYSNFGF